MKYSFTNPMPIVVLISGNGSTLQAIIDAISNKQLPAKINAVISNRADAYGLERAQKANIPTHILTKEKFTTKEAYDEALQKIITPYQPALIILAGFMRILTASFVHHFANKILNIHPALLPKHRGTNTHERVLAAKDLEHGTSVHFVTEELDGGPLIAQAKIKVAADDSPETLKQKVHQLEHRLYPAVIRQIAEDHIVLMGNMVYFKNKKLEKPLLFENDLFSLI